MVIHIPGGLDVPMKSTTIGVALGQAFKNVPVALNATALIPDTTATVMLILNKSKYVILIISIVILHVHP